MKFEKFEDVLAWQLGRELTVNIYRILKDSRDFGFKDQIQRSSVSIMNNIAEGFGRRGDRELVRFLQIAKGSCAEVRSLLYVGNDLGYFLEPDFNHLFSKSVRINKLLIGFINSVQNPLAHALRKTLDQGPGTKDQ